MFFLIIKRLNINIQTPAPLFFFYTISLCIRPKIMVTVHRIVWRQTFWLVRVRKVSKQCYIFPCLKVLNSFFLPQIEDDCDCRAHWSNIFCTFLPCHFFSPLCCWVKLNLFYGGSVKASYFILFYSIHVNIITLVLRNLHMLARGIWHCSV